MEYLIMPHPFKKHGSTPIDDLGTRALHKFEVINNRL